MKRLGCAVGWLLLVLAAGQAQAKKTEAVTDLKDALKQAKADQKLLFIQYGREACGNCQALKQYIASKQLKLPTNEYVYADLNCDDRATSQEFFKHFEVDGKMLPFVVVADPEGRLLASRTGYGDVNAYEDLIKAAKKKLPKEPKKTPANAGRAPAPPAPAPAAAVVPRAENRESRTWTSQSGSSLEASLLEEQADYVILKTADGAQMKIQSAKLSAEDQEYLRTLRPGAEAREPKEAGGAE